MKFLNLVRCAFGLATASLLMSCGGGGAQVVTTDNGAFALNPPAATWYANVKNTLQIGGGTPPFHLTSSEPGIFPVPEQIGNRTLDVVPGQPAVVDAGLPPDALPVRTVNVTARSAEGFTATAAIKVAINFLTGYNFTIRASQATVPPCAAVSICVAGESLVEFDTAFNGALYRGHQFRIEKVRGPWQFVDPLTTNNLVDAVTVTADEEGKFTTIIRVAPGIPTQVALLKVTDIPTGAYSYRGFFIDTASAATTLTLIPPTISLTGADATVCGSGTTDVLVFDGATPYSAICTDTRVVVTSPTSTTQPGKFTVVVGQQAAGQCLTNVPCVISDANGLRAVLNITTTIGAAGPAPTPLTVAPNTLTLTCGASGAVTVVGGTGTYSAASSNSRITAVVSGNTVTITRLTGDTGPVAPPTGVVSITDGASIASVTVTATTPCP